MPDRDTSDVADPDLGAATLEDNATGGGGGAGGFEGGGGVEDWSDDEEEEEEAHAARRLPTGQARVPQAHQPHQAVGRSAEAC